MVPPSGSTPPIGSGSATSTPRRNAIAAAASSAGIRARLATFRETWAEIEPKDVAPLERDFPSTLAYLAVQARARHDGQEGPRECRRTTRPLERVQRHFRPKARQVVIAHSETGAEASIEFVRFHRDLASAAINGQLWVQRLEDALLAL